MVHEMESGVESGMKNDASEMESGMVEAEKVKAREEVESVTVGTVTPVVKAMSVAAESVTEGVERMTEVIEAATEVIEVIEGVEDVSIVCVALEEYSVRLEEDQALGDGPSRRHQCRWQKQDALSCGSRGEFRREGQDRKDGGLQRRQRQQSE